MNIVDCFKKCQDAQGVIADFLPKEETWKIPSCNKSLNSEWSSFLKHSKFLGTGSFGEANMKKRSKIAKNIIMLARELEGINQEIINQTNELERRQNTWAGWAVKCLGLERYTLLQPLFVENEWHYKYKLMSDRLIGVSCVDQILFEMKKILTSFAPIKVELEEQAKITSTIAGLNLRKTGKFEDLGSDGSKTEFEFGGVKTHLKMWKGQYIKECQSMLGRSRIWDLFGGKREFDKLPILERTGFSLSIDPQYLKYPIMRGTILNSKCEFIAIRVFVNDIPSSLTITQDYNENKATWISDFDYLFKSEDSDTRLISNGKIGLPDVYEGIKTGIKTKQIKLRKSDGRSILEGTIR